MNSQQAYSILGLTPSATPEEVKKQFRKLSKEFHPDINKAPDAEAQFKKINEAHQFIQSGGSNTSPDWNNPFRSDRYTEPFSTIFSPFKKNNFASHIQIDLTISFKEAVQGCQKHLSYSRKVKCHHCQGAGNKPINNGCQRCGGQGQLSTKNGGAIFIQICPDCRGNRKTSPCENCSSNGTINSQSSFQLSVPPAVSNDTSLRLEGVGNFSGSFMGLSDQYTDVYVNVNVTPDSNMKLIDKDVVSNINIPLFNALKGCSQTVQSLNGDQEIIIPGGTKNKDEISIMTGDNNNITHRIVVNVDYPANIDKLIDMLSEEGK